MARAICQFCFEDSDYICERCLRCEKCDAVHDKTRPVAEQHGNRWIWHRSSMKGLQLIALAVAGHGKGDNPGAKKE